jgi:hypothetical protein
MATTSGSAGFNLDLTELVEEAFERAGSELRTGYDLKTARRSLNLLFADWANRGINMWTFEQGTITLTQGLNTYAVPTDTVDLLDHVIRTQPNVASTQSDLTITRISVSTYATLPNKLTQARPIQVWYQRLDGQNMPTVWRDFGNHHHVLQQTTIVPSPMHRWASWPHQAILTLDSETIYYTYVDGNDPGRLFPCPERNYNCRSAHRQCNSQALRSTTFPESLFGQRRTAPKPTSLSTGACAACRMLAAV